MTESQVITRKSASNLALAFMLLPKPRREAMAVLYAFCREIDDIADEESRSIEDRRASLKRWEAEIIGAFERKPIHLPVVKEIAQLLPSYPLSLEHFLELIRGVETDLTKTRYANWEELDLYCYRVASVVGLLSIEIFGYRDKACREYAVHLGRALQLTNILRDVGGDAARGRVYLPTEVLVRSGVDPEAVVRGLPCPGFGDAASLVAARARDYYSKARSILPDIDRGNMAAAEMMGAVYWKLLRKLEDSNFDVLRPIPPRLSKLQKVGLVARLWLETKLFGSVRPYYGV